MTVKELRDQCNLMIKLGHGKKEIWISNDDEGNGYHMLFYPFLYNTKEIKECFEYSCTIFHDDINNVVILG